jgi:hypothetical protein
VADGRLLAGEDIAIAPPIDPDRCPGCDGPITRSQFGCRRCWFQLPAELRRRVWANFRRPLFERISGLPELYAEALLIWRGDS